MSFCILLASEHPWLRGLNGRLAIEQNSKLHGKSSCNQGMFPGSKNGTKRFTWPDWLSIYENASVPAVSLVYILIYKWEKICTAVWKIKRTYMLIISSERSPE